MLNLAVQNVFYIQSYVESAFTYNLGLTIILAKSVHLIFYLRIAGQAEQVLVKILKQISVFLKSLKICVK